MTGEKGEIYMLRAQGKPRGKHTNTIPAAVSE